jgi:hypothetical protein
MQTLKIIWKSSKNQDHHKLEGVHKIAKIQGRLETRYLETSSMNKIAKI